MDNRKQAQRAITHSIFLTLALIAVTAVGSLLLVSQLRQALLSQRNRIVEQAEELIAGDIAWASAEPSIAGGLVLHDVVVGDIIRIPTVAVRTTIWDALQGAQTSTPLVVRLNRPRLTVDAERDQQTITAIRNLVAGDEAERGQQRPLLVEVVDGSLAYQDASASVGLAGVSLDIAIQDSNVEFEASATTTYVRTTLGDEFFDLNLGWNAAGDFDAVTGALAANLSINRAEGTHLVAEPLSLRIEQTGQSVSVRRIQGDDPLDLAVNIDLAASDAVLTVVSRDLLPSDLVTLRGPWESLQPWLQERYTMSLALDYSIADAIVERVAGSLATVVRAEPLPEALAIDAAFEWAGDRLDVSRLWARGATGSVTFAGSYLLGEPAPSGVLSFNGFSYADLPTLSGRVAVQTSGDEIEVESDDLTVASESISSLRGQVSIDQFFVDIDATVELAGSGGSLVADVRTSGVGDISAVIELIDVETERIARIAAVAIGESAPFELPAGLLTGAVRVNVSEGRTRIDVPYLSARDPNTAERLAIIAGYYDNGTIVLQSLVAQIDGVRIGSSALIRIGSGGTVDISGQLRVDELQYDIRAIYRRADGLRLTTDQGITVRLDRTAQSALRLAIDLNEAVVPLPQTTVSGRIDLLYRGLSDWDLDIADLVLANLPGPDDGIIDLRAAIRADESSAEIALIRIDDGTRALAGTFSVSYEFTPAVVVRGNGTLARVDGRERYSVNGAVDSSGIDVELLFEAAPAAFLGNTFSAGTFSGRASIAGPLSDPDIALEVTSEGLRLGQDEASISFRARLDDSAVTIEQAQVVALQRDITIASLQLSRIDGSVNGRGEVSIPAAVQTRSLSFSGSTVAPTRDVADIISGFDPVDWPADLTVRVGPSVDQPVHSYAISWMSETLEVRRLDGAVRFRLASGGSLSVRLAEPFPVRAAFNGTFSDGEVEIQSESLTVDLVALGEQFLAPAGLEIISGSAGGQVRVVGALGDPDIFGTVSFRDLSLRLPFSPDLIGPAQGALILEEKLIRLPATNVTVGQAETEVTANVLLSRLAPESFEVSVVTLAETGLAIDSTFGPVQVDGIARGNARIAGAPGGLEISGDLRIAGAQVGIIPGSPEEPEVPLAIVVDLAVETGRGNRFVWPATAFPVIRGNFATDQRIRVRVDSAAETFSLTGALELQSGDIFYFDRSFFLREGVITFNETQDRFDPQISARAELREATPDGPVTIQLAASQQSLSEFSPRLESNPPLTGPEIIAILGGNIFQTNEQGTIDLSAALLSTSDIVTQFGVVRQIEETVREQLDLDLFAIRTSVVQNILLTALGPTDITTTQPNPSLGTFLNDTSVFAGRYLGDSVFLQGLVALRGVEDQDNAADSGVRRLGGVLIDSEIQLEWQTPFFLLEWTLAPENPEELFIRDNTFTFSWSFSY